MGIEGSTGNDGDSSRELEDKLKKLAESPESIPDSELKEALNSYASALASEFETKTKTAESPKQVAEFTRQYFRENVTTLAAQVIWLANNAESESVKLSAAKYGINIAVQIEDDDKDPIKDLLENLTKSDNSKSNTKVKREGSNK